MTNERTGDVADVTSCELLADKKLFGRYTLVKIFGRGGIRVVWLARDGSVCNEAHHVDTKFAGVVPCHMHTIHASSYG